MPAIKIVKIRKRQEIPYGLPYVLGLQILSLMREGYRKFEIEDLGEVIEVRTWRLKREMRKVESHAVAVP